jgi:hypothetical protein
MDFWKKQGRLKMNELAPISSLFDMKYGINLELVNLIQCKNSDANAIPFVSRTENNNGVSAFVEEEINQKPNPAHTLSVACGGSVLATFYQPLPYYSGRDVYILLPKKPMTVIHLLFYSKCINANKYKYNYGRQANKTLKNVLVPKEMPCKFYERLFLYKQELSNSIEITPYDTKKVPLDISRWKPFVLGEIFDIKKGKRLVKEDFTCGNTPFIGAIDSNNGYRDFIDEKPIHQGNTITVNYNGSVGEAFYQPEPFWASDDVNVLYPKFKFNKYIGLFIITIIRQDKYRFNYGRKWEMERMKESIILLPSMNNEVDVGYIERYIKSLPYSKNI